MLITKMIAVLAVITTTTLARAQVTLAPGDYTAAAANARMKLAAFPVPLELAHEILLGIQCADGELRVVPLSTAASYGLPIEIIHRNGVNTNYGVLRDGCLVLANRWPTKTGVLYYSGYNDAIDNEVMHKAGLDYFDHVLTHSANRLRERRVYSLAIPSKLVADVIPDSALKPLLVAEHTDDFRLWPACTLKMKTKHLCRAAVPFAQLLREFEDILALNQALAYSCANSTAYAQGFTQYTYMTYKQVGAEYPTSANRARLLEGCERPRERTHGRATPA
jgi:hypothetical protein